MAVLQYAIDVIEQDRALWLARQALANGVQWLEAGHVLIKAAGVGVVSKLKALKPRWHHRGRHEDHGHGSRGGQAGSCKAGSGRGYGLRGGQRWNNPCRRECRQ